MSNESIFLDKLNVLMHRKLEGCKTAHVGGNSCRSHIFLKNCLIPFVEEGISQQK